jgi:pantetheine-phosphate adenylyltransferase
VRRVGLFPGTFDPVTMGHMDILGRALHLFDRMIVAVAHRHHKETLFTIEQRVEMLISGLSSAQARVVEVSPFEGLLVDFARRRQVSGIVRGLRFVSDFEYEFQMALMNQRLCHEIDTIFLMPTEQYSYLNASLVKEVARNGGSLQGLVTPAVERRLQIKFTELRNVRLPEERPGDAGRRASPEGSEVRAVRVFRDEQVPGRRGPRRDQGTGKGKGRTKS